MPNKYIQYGRKTKKEQNRVRSTKKEHIRTEEKGGRAYNRNVLKREFTEFLQEW